MNGMRLWSAVIAVGAGLACETPAGPSGDVAGTAVLTGGLAASQAVVARATGSAQRDALGQPVLLNFSAVKHGDGSVTGSYHYRALGADPVQWLKVRVTCMTVVDGNKAWVAGITEDAFLPQLIGRVSYFYAFDNGEGAGADADIVSLVRAGDVDGEDQLFCDELPTVLPNRVIVRGNVQISG